MMYHATYVPEFYRALHALVHAEFRASESADSLRDVLLQPLAFRGRSCRAPPACSSAAGSRCRGLRRAVDRLSRVSRAAIGSCCRC